MKTMFLVMMAVVMGFVFVGCPIEVTVMMPTPNEVVDVVEDVWTPPAVIEDDDEDELVVPAEGEGEGEVVIPAEGEGEGEVIQDCTDTAGLIATIGTVTGYPGETVIVPITLNRSTCAVYGYSLQLTTDEGVEIIGCVEAVGLSESNVVAGDLLIASSTWDMNLEGELVVFQVKISGSAKSGDNISIQWNYEYSKFYDDWAEPIKGIGLVDGMIFVK